MMPPVPRRMPVGDRALEDARELGELIDETFLGVGWTAVVEHARRRLLPSRCASEAEIDAAGIERLEHLELLGDLEGRVVGHHDAARAEAASHAARITELTTEREAATAATAQLAAEREAALGQVAKLSADTEAAVALVTELTTQRDAAEARAKDLTAARDAALAEVTKRVGGTLRV